MWSSPTVSRKIQRNRKFITPLSRRSKNRNYQHYTNVNSPKNTKCKNDTENIEHSRSGKMGKYFILTLTWSLTYFLVR